MPLFQWFYDVELCMDMNTSCNNTNRLFPLPSGEGQGEGGIITGGRFYFIPGPSLRSPQPSPGGRGSKCDSDCFSGFMMLNYVWT